MILLSNGVNHLQVWHILSWWLNHLLQSTGPLLCHFDTILCNLLVLSDIGPARDSCTCVIFHYPSIYRHTLCAANVQRLHETCLICWLVHQSVCLAHHSHCTSSTNLHLHHVCMHKCNTYSVTLSSADGDSLSCTRSH